MLNAQITKTECKSTPIQSLCYIQQNKNNGLFSIQKKLINIIESLSNKKEDISIDEQINEKFLNLDFGSEFNIDAQKIGVADAVFFINLLNEQNLIDYTVQNDNLSLSVDNKPLQVTNSLLNMLKTSFDTQKAIRLDFETDVTVILKLDSNGKIQTHFIPGTPEAETYLKNNIPSLKQIFDNEQINYSYIGYSKNKNKNNKEKRSNK